MEPIPDQTPPAPAGIPLRTIVIHTALLAATFVTTTLAGVQWLLMDPFELTNFEAGMTYASLLLLMLASHEFGHYVAARLHGVEATLPYFIPFPSVAEFALLNPFGTLGAVIRLRSGLPSRRILFDIGSAGPIAGFVVSIVVLVIGFLTLPGKEYLYTIHPEYATMDHIPTGGWVFGRTLFYILAETLFAPPGAFIPPMNEIYHYPFLCVGWFGMLVTAINLIPVGQLDGGHIVYAMFGTTYHRIAQIALMTLAVLGTAGFLPLVGIPFEFGYTGWLFWALVLAFFSRVLRLNRPALPDESPLDHRRLILGWICVVMFAGSFSLTPFSFNVP